MIGCLFIYSFDYRTVTESILITTWSKNFIDLAGYCLLSYGSTDRQATKITFEDESEIGKVVSDWTCYYTKKHRFKAIMISLQEGSIDLFTW